ncbi:MAG: cytochrome c biogenesis protein ResB [Desulfocapsa sp.]|nr:cytochrome c biogenesis protein ResB [Desulfocapsa sp.]
MQNKKNPIYSFFSSVKLALFTLFLLAITSIIGTVIPQKESFSYYVQNYSESAAKVFHVLSIPDMYSSWWFLGLLTLLVVNLIVCSFNRFPGVWKQIKADNLETPLTRLSKMRLKDKWVANTSEETLATELTQSLAGKGWKTEQRQRDDSLLLFAQKGAISRTGVYIVHASIIVIFIGALIGELYGFKGSVMLPETKTTDTIYAYDTQEPIPLGFEVRCDRFDLEMYATGMPKAYRSHLTILENGKVTFEKNILVNDPLTYKGLTFYQSSYKGYQDFLLKITDQESGEEETVIIPFQRRTNLATHKASIGIINAETRGQSVTRIKVWFDDEQGPASTFWLKAGDQATVERTDKKFIIAGKQMYATGLQVAKDPGVWVVYLGCGMMILGLFVAFFMSHKRIWLLLTKEDDKTSVMMSGSANKNKAGFEKMFFSLTTELKTDSDN